MKMIRKKIIYILAGLWINLCSPLGISSMSMEAEQSENTTALAVFSNVDMIHIMRENLRSQNALEVLWPVFASCHFLHDRWLNPEFCPIKHPEFLILERQKQLPTSPFLHWFLWTLESDLNILQGVEWNFLHPYDESTEGGERRLMTKKQGDEYCFDYHLTINIGVSLSEFQKSTIIVRKLEQFFYPRNLWEASPCLSLQIQADLWLGELLLINLNSKGQKVVDDYLNSFNPNIFKKSLSKSSNFHYLLRHYKNSPFYNQALLDHPEIGFLYAITADRKCSSLIISQKTFAKTKYNFSVFDKIKGVDFILRQPDYTRKNIEIYERRRRDLFEKAIQAKIPHAWEIYENICLFLDEDNSIDNIGGIQKPD